MKFHSRNVGKQNRPRAPKRKRSWGSFTGEGVGLWNSSQAPGSDFLLAILYKALPCCMCRRGPVGYTHILRIAPWPPSGEWGFGAETRVSRDFAPGKPNRGGGEEQLSPRECGFARGVTSSFPSPPDLTSLLTSGRPAGVHLPGLQPSAGQFFASLDPINEASAILSPLSSNPRNSVQHQFQDTFPGTETLLSDGLTGQVDWPKTEDSSRGHRGAAIPELVKEATKSGDRNRKSSQIASLLFCRLPGGGGGSGGGPGGAEKVCAWAGGARWGEGAFPSLFSGEWLENAARGVAF